MRLREGEKDRHRELRQRKIDTKVKSIENNNSTSFTGRLQLFEKRGERRSDPGEYGRFGLCLRQQGCQRHRGQRASRRPLQDEAG